MTQIMAATFKNVVELYNSRKREAAKVGLAINANKTKNMPVGKRNNTSLATIVAIDGFGDEELGDHGNVVEWVKARVVAAFTFFVEDGSKYLDLPCQLPVEQIIPPWFRRKKKNTWYY